MNVPLYSQFSEAIHYHKGYTCMLISYTLSEIQVYAGALSMQTIGQFIVSACILEAPLKSHLISLII